MKKKKKPTVKVAEKAVTNANNGAKFLMQNKYLLIVIGVGVGGYFVYKGVKKSLNKATDFLKSAPDDFISGNLDIDKSKLTITKDEARLLAKGLLEAFNDTIFGFPATDEKAIKEIFSKIKTPEDYQLVFNTFGRRPRVFGGTPTTWLDKKTAVNKDLDQWLKAELNSLDGEVYKIVKQRLKSAKHPF